MLGKERLERTEHHAVLEQHEACAEAGKHPHDEDEERHLHVVHRDTAEHHVLRLTVVDGHRRAVGNVLQRHVHIMVT